LRASGAGTPRAFRSPEVTNMSRGCQRCYRSEPTCFVELHHNVGMLVMRQTHSTRAALCSDCLHQAYRHHLVRNLTLGWWGTISFFATLYYVFANTVTYVTTLRALRRLATAPARTAAAATTATTVAAELSADETRARLEPFEHNVRLRLRAGEAIEDIGRDLAVLRGVSPAAARGFVESLSSSSPAAPV
jgi:hypothetical protein